MHATHINHKVESPTLANPNAMQVEQEKHGTSTSSSRTQLSNSKMSLPSKMKLKPTDQQKLHSLSITTSCHTQAVSTTTRLVEFWEVTPSKSSVGEMKEVSITGSAQTHGTHHGECQDTSKLSGETAVLIHKSLQAHHSSPRSSLNEIESLTLQI